ncbi:MAG: SpoIVB peptidase [Lachnospiraceae bacterium]|nr:SpoIVB peptidase [Lachnospiraceae bacterium]
MGRKIWYQRILYMVLAGLVIYTVYAVYSYMDRAIPDRIHMVVNEEGKFEFGLPIEAQLSSQSEEVVFSGESNIPSHEIVLNLSDEFSVFSEKTGTYDLKLKLFGILPFKEIKVNVVEEEQVIPCGFQVGIYLETNGVMVVGTARMADTEGKVVEPAAELVRSGDYITAVDGNVITDKNDLISCVKNCNGNAITLTVNRNGERLEESLRPVEVENGEYKLGIWVRDDAQGIGTMTYVKADGSFGALGHGVSDVDTGKLLEASGGKLYPARILSIIKGESGSPGGLSGVIEYQESHVLGAIETNCEQGIYGTASEELYELCEEYCCDAYMDIAFKQEVELGAAQVRCEIDGVIRDYQIQITKLDNSPGNVNKGMEIRVVDEALLQETNGIVQGMSGSPILQNGKLIGAVTHVFVNDSTKGYGIFIENMLEN